jgi:hypothetical protein
MVPYAYALREDAVRALVADPDPVESKQYPQGYVCSADDIWESKRSTLLTESVMRQSTKAVMDQSKFTSSAPHNSMDTTPTS